MFRATVPKLERVTFFSSTDRKAAAMADALIEQRGHVLIVTMNRPEARNALSGEMLSIMVEAWDRVDSDPDIRVCILTGAGGYFCAGMDLKAATAKPPGDSFKDGSYDPSRIDGLLKGRRLTKPLIAAVEGPAIAGGTEILQGTDIRVAGREREVRHLRGALEPVPDGRLGGAAGAPDSVHHRLRSAADRTAHHRGRGPGIRTDRSCGARRAGARQGTRDRGGDRGQRSAGRAGDPAFDPARPRACTRTRPSRSTPGSVSRCS